jgi:hypothetical protein
MFNLDRLVFEATIVKLFFGKRTSHLTTIQVFGELDIHGCSQLYLDIVSLRYLNCSNHPYS